MGRHFTVNSVKYVLGQELSVKDNKVETKQSSHVPNLHLIGSKPCVLSRRDQKDKTWGRLSVAIY